MREILNLQFGQCGNNIGTKFWEIITNEHGINSCTGVYEGESDLQLQRAEVYFTSSSQGKYVPRSIMVDLDGSTLDHIVNSNIGPLFQPDHFVGGSASASNNYAKGYYTDGAELLDQIMEIVRLEVENCDALQGFQIFHGLGGGTGSGLGALVLSKLREEWPDRIISTVSIVPSPKSYENVVESYNAVLGLRAVAEWATEVHLYDNGAVARLCASEIPGPDEMNELIMRTMAAFTASQRFPGQLNCGLRKMSVNLVPYPGMHLLGCSYAPVPGGTQPLQVGRCARLLVRQLLRPSQFMLRYSSQAGRHITAGVLVRGRVSTRDVEATVREVQDRHSAQFVLGLPDSVFSAVCDIGPAHSGSISGTAVTNHSGAITELLRGLLATYCGLLHRRAYLHWLTAEGMPESELTAAAESLSRLADDYERAAGSTDSSLPYTCYDEDTLRHWATLRRQRETLAEFTRNNLSMDIPRPSNYHNPPMHLLSRKFIGYSMYVEDDHPQNPDRTPHTCIRPSILDKFSTDDIPQVLCLPQTQPFFRQPTAPAATTQPLYRQPTALAAITQPLYRQPAAHAATDYTSQLCLDSQNIVRIQAIYPQNSPCAPSEYMNITTENHEMDFFRRAATPEQLNLKGKQKVPY